MNEAKQAVEDKADGIMSRFLEKSWPSQSIQATIKRQILLLYSNKAPFYTDETEPLAEAEAQMIVQVKGNMRSDSAARLLKAEFFPKREKYVTEDEYLRGEFKEFMESNSELAVRTRMMRTVPNQAEQQRVRIIELPWSSYYSQFQDQQRAKDETVPSTSALRTIRKKYLPHIRKAVKSDVAYATCSNCHIFELMVATCRKSPLEQLKNVFMSKSKNQILALSVCDEQNESCLLGNCSDCTEETTLAKLTDLIDDYDEVYDSEVTWPQKAEYSNRPGGSKSTVYVTKTGSVAEMLIELAQSMFTGAATATGVKVIIL